MDDDKAMVFRRPITGFVCPQGAEMIEQVIATMGEIGYGGIDFGPAGKFVSSRQTPRLQAIARLAESAGLTRNATHYRDYGFDFLEDNASKASFLLHAAEDLEIAAQLGCQSVAFHVGAIEGASSRACLDANAEVFAELAPLGKKLGLLLCLENHFRRPFGRTVPELLAILEAVGSPALAICVDTGHAALVGTPAGEMIRQAGSRLGMLHLCDNMGREDTHLSPGLGVVDWFAVFSALDEIGYEGPLNMEIGGHHPHDSFEPTARAGYHNLLQLLSEYYVIANGRRKRQYDITDPQDR